MIKPTASKLSVDEPFDLDDLLSDLRSELSLKLSIDGKKISLNALELFTREAGLERALGDMTGACLLREKAKKSIKLNDTIMSELLEVQKMLEVKSRQVQAKEIELRAREKLIETQKQRAIQAIRDECS